VIKTVWGRKVEDTNALVEVMEKLDSCKHALIAWSSSKYGAIGHIIKRLTMHLEKLESKEHPGNLDSIKQHITPNSFTHGQTTGGEQTRITRFGMKRATAGQSMMILVGLSCCTSNSYLLHQDRWGYKIVLQWCSLESLRP